MGLNFIGSYCARSRAAVSRNRRICGSVWVAQRARKYSNKNISNPPNKLLSRLKVAAPRHIAKKKSFRSAPRIISGRDSVRGTLLIRLDSAIEFSVQEWRASGPGKHPSQEIYGCDGHADDEEHAGKYTLRTTFTEGEGEADHDDGDERKPASDSAGEGLLQHIDGVFPRRISLSESGSGKEKCETDGDKRRTQPRAAQIYAKKSLHVRNLPVC